ncbi:hypothetical protein LCGC14_0674360 [marine sediment metagenome]|uniref:Uncharacterized protein n=1 Tax=marine sediment metagenome TaxID=412755 RepID=A0A0F9QV78_9ZZZZ
MRIKFTAETDAETELDEESACTTEPMDDEDPRDLHEYFGVSPHDFI